MPDTAKRFAAIDVGTNSIHMIIAERHNGRGYRVVDREKEMVQLGLSSLDGQPLTEEAMQRGITAIAHMNEIARRWEVEEVIAVATSAVREAPNRRDFLRRVKNDAGVRVRVISGEEEADYIFRAVRTAVDIDGSTALSIDIGGGSIEMIAGTADEIYFTASEPLGSLRLAQRFALTDRALPRNVEQCRAFVRRRAAKAAKRIRRIGFDMSVGTSGTIQTLAAITSEAPAGDSTSLGLRELHHDKLRSMIPELAAMTAAERAAKFSIDDKRAATIVAGAIALDEVMSLTGTDTIIACPVAMREGIVESRVAELARTSRSGGSLRRKSVTALAQRTDCDLRHAMHVARLATRIFDQTKALHGLERDARDLLHSAAILHESGMHISDRGHHRHSYYLIRHADLRGFTEDQLLVIANVARYYRKSPPDPEHPNFAELTPELRTQVQRLAAILRIAEGLDRGHRQRVRDVAVQTKNQKVAFVARTRANASVELTSAVKRARYFASLFEKRVVFESN
jgi:exopolyphosphatase/guanosine-5'-triphosphate,3'-diphosphate pyrophosphatase